MRPKTLLRTSSEEFPETQSWSSPLLKMLHEVTPTVCSLKSIIKPLDQESPVNSTLATEYLVKALQHIKLRVSNRVTTSVNAPAPVQDEMKERVVNSGTRNSANIRYGEPRKSQTRFYRLDKDGNKQYVDNLEQSRLEEVD